MQVKLRRFIHGFFAALFSAVYFLTSAAAAPDFKKDIQPILEAKCVLCHGTGKEKGGLQLHTREAMLKGGDTDAAIV